MKWGRAGPDMESDDEAHAARRSEVSAGKRQEQMFRSRRYRAQSNG